MRKFASKLDANEKYKLGDIATVEISGVDKKIKDGEEDIRLCNFVDVYYNWAITMARHDSFYACHCPSQ